MVKWSAWKSVLAGAVIGFVEAAGSEPARRRLRTPGAVVRIDRRRPPDPRAELGVWFLDPVPDPRPQTTDRRHPLAGLRLATLSPLRLLRSLGVTGS